MDWAVRDAAVIKALTDLPGINWSSCYVKLAPEREGKRERVRYRTEEIIKPLRTAEIEQGKGLSPEHSDKNIKDLNFIYPLRIVESMFVTFEDRRLCQLVAMNHNLVRQITKHINVILLQSRII